MKIMTRFNAVIFIALCFISCAMASITPIINEPSVVSTLPLATHALIARQFDYPVRNPETVPTHPVLVPAIPADLPTNTTVPVPPKKANTNSEGAHDPHNDNVVLGFSISGAILIGAIFYYCLHRWVIMKRRMNKMRPEDVEMMARENVKDRDETDYDAGRSVMGKVGGWVRAPGYWFARHT